MWRRFVRLWWLALLVLLALAWAMSASRVGTQVQGCPAGCATVDPRSDGPLRVMSLNVLHGFPRFEHLQERLDQVAAEIRRQDADVVCLQEVPWTVSLGDGAAYLAEGTGMNHVTLRANGNRWAILFEEGEAILSRYPLSAVESAELQPPASFFEHRVALAATVATPWGDVRVVVTHLTHGEQEVNRAQAAFMERFVDGWEGGPVVIAGDFNAEQGSPQIQALTRRWVDAFRTTHPDGAGYTCCVGDLSAGPEEPLEKRIDYVFLFAGPEHPAWVVESRRVLVEPARRDEGWLWASDHVGLLVAISLEESE